MTTAGQHRTGAVTEIINLSLVCLVWETLDQGTRVCYLGMWDINCWYQAQMPSCLEESPDVVCPYLSMCEVITRVLSN